MKSLRERFEPLFRLHHAKRPALVFAAGLRGSEELERLLGVPAIGSDWTLEVTSQEQLDDLIMGARAVYEYDGQFPDFSEWRKKFPQA